MPYRLLTEFENLFAAPFYDEFLVLPFAATNADPFPFSWVNASLSAQNYGSALLRISREYDRRF